MEPVIEVRDLSKRYGDVTAVSHVTLSVDQGALFGLLGPNGSGKTTMIRVLTGQTRPTGGSAKVLGIDPDREGLLVRERVGIIPEQESPPSFLTAMEYLEFVGSVRKIPDIGERADHWFEFLEFGDKKHVLCKDLSRGTRQKLMFAQAFIHEPALALIDEPLINFDPIMQDVVKEFLAGYVRSGKTIFLCTHILEVAEEVCSSFAILHRGPSSIPGLWQTWQRAGCTCRNSSSPSCGRVTMPELFMRMMKEEWRIHSTMFGQVSFALFPVMIFGIVFMGSFLLPSMISVIPPNDLALIIHAMFLVLGMMVGGFGLLGNEMMNRRLGQASLLAYSARSLPLSERFIFANFAVKDTVYYFVLWVLPFGAGYLAASPFTGVPPARGLLLLLTLAFSFMAGLCTVFLLSSIYVRSGRACGILVTLLGTGFLALLFMTGTNPARYFPPYLLFTGFSWWVLIASAGTLAGMYLLSIVLFIPDREGKTQVYGDLFAPLDRVLSGLPHPPLVAKDFVDLYRSGIGIGQALFSFAIPLVVIWFFLSLAGSFLPPHGLLFLFAMITGVIASTIYTWVTEFDSFGQYACLPVAAGTLIQSKITTFALLQVIPAAFISTAAVLSGGAAHLFPAVALCLSFSLYAAGVMAFLCGLSPSVLVYDVKVLFTYLVLDGVVFAIFSALSFANPFYAISSVVLLIPAWLCVKAAMRRWDAVDPAGL